ncbi:hypothetical protein D3C80_1556200 [compost metagenome]
MTQGNGQLGLGLTLQCTLEQAVALFVLAQFVCCARRAEVIQQRLPFGLGSSVQVLLRGGPAPLGQVQLALLDRQLHTPAAVAVRPGVDHASGSGHQADQGIYQQHQQPDQHHQRQCRPQARLVTEVFIGNQHVASVLGNCHA